MLMAPLAIAALLIQNTVGNFALFRVVEINATWYDPDGRAAIHTNKNCVSASILVINTGYIAHHTSQIYVLIVGLL